MSLREQATHYVILVAAAAGSLVLPRTAAAGLPQMEDALVGRANEEWFARCPDGSTTGVACQGSVCGVDFALEGAALQRFITVDGTAWDLHAGNGEDLAVAGLLNAVCNDTAAVFTGPLGMQNVLGQDFGRLSLNRLLPSLGQRLGVDAAALPETTKGANPLGTGRGMVTADPGPLLGLGGAVELGSSGYYSFMVPVSYAHSFSRDAFANVNAAISHAILPEGGFTKLNALPSYGVLGGDQRFNWGWGAYAPIDVAYTSISVIDYSLTAFDVGVGSIGVASALIGRTQVAGGAVVDVRYSSAAGTQLPMTALVRALHPISIIDAFASLSIGSNPIHAGTTTMLARLGAEWGQWEFGYQLGIGTGNVSHMIGFMHRQRLRRTEMLERPATEPTRPPPASDDGQATPTEESKTPDADDETEPEPADEPLDT